MKNLVLLILGVALTAELPAQINWQNEDLKNDGLFGISTEKCYAELLKGKQPKLVIVAVMDSGIDTLHEDLRSVLWTNPKDGTHGYNFTAASENIRRLKAIVTSQKAFYDSLSYVGVPEKYKTVYQEYRKLANQYEAIAEQSKILIQSINENKKKLEFIVKRINQDNPSVEDFRRYQVQDANEKRIIDEVLLRLGSYKNFSDYKYNEIDKVIERLNYNIDMTDTSANPPILKDINSDISFDKLGMAFIYGSTEDILHGTHVSGIIAADRSNSIGIKGVADDVEIMFLKIQSGFPQSYSGNPIAGAIRYATDKGAKVINMSIVVAPDADQRGEIDNAVRYAMKHDVLIIHAAGNDGLNLDRHLNNYSAPDKYYADGGKAAAFLVVGATGPQDDSTLIWPRSNYGKNSIDVFAPGVNIFSTTPGNNYKAYSGTSMAAPVVAGLAALIREYYPKLTAVQVKDVIMRSVVKPAHPVNIQEGNETKKVMLTEICASGGVVNAYNALKLAASYR